MVQVVTKTGDLGQTSIKDRRIDKTDDVIVLLGELDYINSLLGVYDNRPDHQTTLYAVMSHIAGYVDMPPALEKVENEIRSLKYSDFIKDKFVVPRHTLHLIRASIRKAEILAWKAKFEDVARFLNRFSDLYFIRAEVFRG